VEQRSRGTAKAVEQRSRGIAKPWSNEAVEQRSRDGATEPLFFITII
jgi:hypothetical protein